MPLAPPTANRGEYNERPLSSFPANALPSGRTKQTARARPNSDLASVVVVFVVRECCSAEIKNRDRCCEVNKQRDDWRCEQEQPCATMFHACEAA
jgi:hypothetical protein